MLVKISDKENPVKDGHVVGFAITIAIPPGALCFGVNLRELQIGLSVGAVDEVFGVVAIRAGWEQLGIYKG